MHPAAARALFSARGSHGVALITDGSQLTGMPPGTYERGGRTLTIEGAACRLPDGTLAGSVSPFDRDLRNASDWLTTDPLALAALSSGNAAIAMGIDRPDRLYSARAARRPGAAGRRLAGAGDNRRRRGRVPPRNGRRRLSGAVVSSQAKENVR